MIRSIFASVFLITAIALPGSSETSPEFAPHGPDYIFASVDAAAIDALALAHREQVRSKNSRLSRGGAIVAEDGGFTYREIQTARPGAPDELRLRLGRKVVAHFHTYPTQGSRQDRRNETHSPADRWVVDEMDPRGRPSYVLTPSLRVVVYRGRAMAVGADTLVADLSQASASGLLAQR